MKISPELDITDIMDSVLSRTYLHDENMRLVSNLAMELSELNETIRNMILSTNKIDQNLKEKIEEYIEIDNKIQRNNDPRQIIKIDSRSFKKVKAAHNVLKSELNKNREEVDLMKEQSKLMLLREKKEQEQCYLLSNLRDTLDQVKGKLDHYGYIGTYKGLIASNITNAHPMVMAELLTNNDLNMTKLPSEDIGVILAMFGESQRKQRSFENENRKSPSIISVRNIVKSLVNNVSNLGNEFDEDENLIGDMEYLNAVKEWITYKDDNKLPSYGDISRKYDISDGSFVKNMIKLQRLCEELQKVAMDVMDDPIFKEKLESIRSIVCRDIVVPESLYV